MSQTKSFGEDRVESLYRRTFFVNLLDPASTVFNYNPLAVDDYLNELHVARVGVSNVSVATPTPPLNYIDLTINRFSQWYALFEKHPEEIQLVTGSKSIEEVKSQGRAGIIFGLQGASQMEDLDLLRIFHRLGLRILALTYQGRNAFGDGSGEPKDSGLSRLGERLIEEMNKLGILIDLSHVGRKATIEAIERSKEPVVFSHSNAKGLCSHVRNLDDEQIKATSEKGGLVGICAWGPLVRRERSPTMNDFLDHIDYVVRLVGSHYVGVGLDLNPRGQTKDMLEQLRRRHPEIGSASGPAGVEGLRSPTEWKNIVKGLMDRSYSDEEIQRILGENALRVFKQVWKD